MKPLAFHPDAAEEAREAAAYYDDIRAGLGDGFKADLAAALQRIADNPLMVAAESGTMRVCSLDRFPYALIYEDQPDQIWVAAIAHHARRPGFWKRRRS